MSRNIRWDDFLLENVLILVETLIELSEQQSDDFKPTLWVEWREDKLRVTGYQTKQRTGGRSKTSEVGTKKEYLIEQIKEAGKSLKSPQQTKELDEIQNVLDCLKELEVREDEKSSKNQGYWKFSLKLKHQTAIREENLDVVKRKWREHPKTSSQNSYGESTATDNGIEWREIFHKKLETQLEFIRHKATERGFEVNVHVPLGLLERKEQQRRGKLASPNNPYELEEEVIVKTYEHDAFLKEVISSNSAEKKHIAIIGEAGAGKTTLLSKVAEFIKDETEFLPIWISLASLQGETETLENYLLNTWFSSIECSKTVEQLKQRFSQGDIWLLLDGADEMAKNSPLDTFKNEKLPDWLRKAQFVLTCRLNVWDRRINNPLTGFETYKTQEFKPEQVDEFIQEWFKYAENIEKGKALQTKLKETRHQKIRSLVTNPLRLSLLCQTFYLDKQGELPETKAGLYERFITYFYEWKPENIPDELRYSDNKKEELHQALSKLALAGIDSDTRFRLNRKFARKLMGEELFKLACDVGWLNLVDRDSRTDKEVYAFFHANFQEYFAALAIDDWDYFLPREHENKPVADRYRIFEPQWKEVILLWLGRDEDDVSDVEKEEFIKALVEFDDGCGKLNFYGFRTFFIAAQAIADFPDCNFAHEIVEQIVKLGFGYFNPIKQKWQISNHQIAKSARIALQYTDRKIAITALIRILPQIHNEYILWQAIESLINIDKYNPQLRYYLLRLIQTAQKELIRIYASVSLFNIDTNNFNSIDVLLGIAQTTRQDSNRLLAIVKLLEITKCEPKILQRVIKIAQNTKDTDILSKVISITASKSPQGLETFTKILEITKHNNLHKNDKTCLNNEIDNCNLKRLSSLLEVGQDDYIRRRATARLGLIAKDNPQVHDTLRRLMLTDEDNSVRWRAADSFIEIDNNNIEAIETLVWLANNDKNSSILWLVVSSLGKIYCDNSILIINVVNAITRLLETADYHIRRAAAESMAKIASRGDLNAIAALIRVIENSQDKFTILEVEHSFTKYIQRSGLKLVVSKLKSGIVTQTKIKWHYKAYYKIIWHCAQNMKYPEFYQAWHQ